MGTGPQPKTLACRARKTGVMRKDETIRKSISAQAQHKMTNDRLITAISHQCLKVAAQIAGICYDEKASYVGSLGFQSSRQFEYPNRISSCCIAPQFGFVIGYSKYKRRLPCSKPRSLLLPVPYWAVDVERNVLFPATSIGRINAPQPFSPQSTVEWDRVQTQAHFLTSW